FRSVRAGRGRRAPGGGDARGSLRRPCTGRPRRLAKAAAWPDHSASVQTGGMRLSPPSSKAEDRLNDVLARHGARLRTLVIQHCAANQGPEPVDIEQAARIRLWKAVERQEKSGPAASDVQR